MPAVLVAYATKYGSTREVAEAIAKKVADHGIKTDVAAAGDVDSLAEYDAVIFGGALYYFRMIREGRHFLSRHRRELSATPLAVFGMGPIEDTEEQFVEARKHLNKALEKHDGIHPVAVALFGGVLEPGRLRFPDANPAMKKVPAADLRDWKAIEEWADSLPGVLGLAGQ